MDFQNADINVIFNKDNYPKFDSNNKCDPYSKCLCLSGKKFKFCCKSKIDEAKKTPTKSKDERLASLYFPNRSKKLVSFKTEHQSIDKKKISYCACQNIQNKLTRAGNGITCTHNVYAHTLAKSSVLNNLTNNCHLYHFNDHKMAIDARKDNIDEYYLKETTESSSGVIAFCKEHDDVMFEEIEKNNNYTGNLIQNYEFALKAIAFSTYYYLMNVKYFSDLLLSTPLVAVTSNTEYNFLADYNDSIKTMFELYSIQNRLIEDIVRLKNNSNIILSDQLCTILLDIPARKIRFSLSEWIIWNGKNCFVNVVNLPSPMIIISSYSTISKSEFLDSTNRIEDFYQLISDLIVDSKNIYFDPILIEEKNDDGTTNLFSLSTEEKLILYKAHRTILQEVDTEIIKKMFEI